MATVELTVTDRRTLVNLIASRAGVLTSSERQNLLERAGLGLFVTRIQFDLSADSFSQQLISKLQDHGTLDDTGQPALVSLLKELRERVKGHEAERDFVDCLLLPYSDLRDTLTPAQMKDVVGFARCLLACRLYDGDIPPDVLSESHRAALPAGLPSHPADARRRPPTGLHTVVAHLVDLPSANRDGATSHPLLVFALHLSKSVEERRPDEAADLRGWADDVIPRWAPGATPASLRRAAGVQQKSERSDETRLVVRVMPLDGDPAVFKKPRADWRVQFDAFIGPQGAAPQRFRDVTDGPEVAVGDLPGQIERLIDDSIATRERPDWIEFFLPAALMSLETDQWCCRLPFDQEGHLGSEHKVVVRSWDRTFIPTHLNQIRRDWEARWALIEPDASADVDDSHVRWVGPDPDPAARSRTLRTDLMASPDTTCIAFAFDPVDPDAAFDHAKAIISAGIPVALWPRKSAVDAGMETPRGAIAHMFGGAGAPIAAGRPTGHLCDAVKRARVEGSGPVDHLAKHVTLMWDDPTDLGALAQLR